MMDGREADSHYAGISNLHAMQAAQNYNAFLLERVLAVAGAAKRALDFGAGLGHFAQGVRSSGLDVVCVEADASMTGRLRSSGFAVHESLGAIAPGSVDFVYSLNVLEHIADDARTLRSLQECLAPGGRLYLYVPAFPILFSALDRAVGHVRRYTRADLQRRLSAAGFFVESSGYVDPLGFCAALSYRFAPGAGGNVSARSVAAYDRWIFPISRALQALTRPWIGKNLEVVAVRPQSAK